MGPETSAGLKVCLVWCHQLQLRWRGTVRRAGAYGRRPHPDLPRLPSGLSDLYICSCIRANALDPNRKRQKRVILAMRP